MSQTAVAIPPPPVAYELRPLSTGEILDRTFTLYRQRFWLYAGLAAIAASFTTVGTFARLTWGVTGAKIGPVFNTRAALIGGVSTILTSLVYFLAYSVTQAATTSAVSNLYLGRETSIGSSLRATRKYWLRSICIVFWQTWSAIWLPILLFATGAIAIAPSRFGIRWLGVTLMVLAAVSLLYAPFAYIRNSLGINACVVEGLTVRHSMRRSKNLVGDRVWRIFGLGLLMYALYLVAGVVQGTAALGMMQTHAWKRALLEAVTLITTFASTTLIAPVGAIGLCLFYIDERVRREGFDVETLMDRAGDPAAPLRLVPRGRGEEVPVIDPLPDPLPETVPESHLAERV